MLPNTVCGGALPALGELLLYDAFLDLCGLTCPLAEVVQLSPANNTMTNDLDTTNAGAVVGEGPLNADTVADTANGEGLADAAALHLNNDSLEVLKPLVIALDNLNEYTNGVANLELGEVGAKLLFFELSDDF